ncbi:MAG: universal stress protein [Ginsengibacter sp.]|jgi:nucleotide-binding universal stress UspA family protein
MIQILVPTDFSSCADNAINFAVQTAKIISVKITLLYTLEIKRNPNSDNLVNQERKKLKTLKNIIKQTEGIEVGILISTDSLQDAIINTIKQKKIDLVIMGTLGASGLKKKLFGSRTSAIIGEVNVPLMVIPYEYKWRKPCNILLASNKFEKEVDTLKCLFELAGWYKARVKVAVFSKQDNDSAGNFLHNESKILEHEEFLKKVYKKDSITAVHLYRNNFELSLQNFIDENKIDVLVMITYTQKFWKRIFNPSKTKRMGYHTHIPLLVIPVNKLDK